MLLHVQVLTAISAFITLNGPCAGDINKSGFSTRKAKLNDDHFSTNTNYIAKFAVLLAGTFFPVHTNGVLAEFAPTKA